jgi:hypothetical protein
MRIGTLEVGPGHPCALIAEPCMEWPLGRTPQGYGQGWHDGAKYFAHRVVAEQFYGPIPKGMCVCHRCDNPSCINPAHLYIGTPSDNQRDAVERRRHRHARVTHCPRGHAYDETNTQHRTRKDGGRLRVCGTCHRERMSAYNERNREVVNARQRARNAAAAEKRRASA